MQIVIDIDDDMYKSVANNDAYVLGDVDWILLENAIANGTPLPEHHGRLIDADAFIAKLEDASKRQKYNELLIDDCLTVDDVFKAIIESLSNEGLAENDAPTIIEAEG